MRLAEFCVPTQSTSIKKDSFWSLIYGVYEGTILEPYDKKILAKLDGNCNIYRKLLLLLKLDTQAYYNMRLILGYEIGANCT